METEFPIQHFYLSNETEKNAEIDAFDLLWIDRSWKYLKEAGGLPFRQLALAQTTSLSSIGYISVEKTGGDGSMYQGMSL
jgi:hypothetical protein